MRINGYDENISMEGSQDGLSQADIEYIKAKNCIIRGLLDKIETDIQSQDMGAKSAAILITSLFFKWFDGFIDDLDEIKGVTGSYCLNDEIKDEKTEDNK